MRIYKLVLVLLSSVLFLMACEKGMEGRSFGDSMVYLTQAVSSGVAEDNRYIVPKDDVGYLENYEIDTINNQLKIFLGIMRSGTEKAREFSVDVRLENDAVNDAIQKGALIYEKDPQKKIMILPDECVELPSSIKVEKDDYESIFYLSVDLNCLNIFSSYVLATGISIHNPSYYEINENLNEVMVLIDVSRLDL